MPIRPPRQESARKSVGTPDALSVLLSQLRAYPLLDAAGEIALARKIEAGHKAETYLTDHPEAADRQQLKKSIADGLEAKQQMVGANIRLVIANAKDFKGQGLEFDDLVQAAMPGLIRAAE